MIELVVMVIFGCFLTFVAFAKEKLLAMLSGPMWIFISVQIMEITPGGQGFFFVSLGFGLIQIYYGLEKILP